MGRRPLAMGTADADQIAARLALMAADGASDEQLVDEVLTLPVPTDLADVVLAVLLAAVRMVAGPFETNLDDAPDLDRP